MTLWQQLRAMPRLMRVVLRELWTELDPEVIAARLDAWMKGNNDDR